MTKAHKKEITVSAVVAVLILFALCFRFIAYTVDNEFIDKFLNFVRTFIYIGLILSWLFSVNKRVVQTLACRTLSSVAVLMLFWIVIREFKWRFILDADILRYLWYAYYIPLLFIPLLSLLTAISLGKREDYHLPKQTALLYAFATLLAVLVMTNDFHQIVFIFPDDAAVWTEYDYRYGIGYFIVILWILACSVSSVFVMLKKCRIPHSRSFLWAPFVPLGISLLYGVLYIMDVPLIRLILGDFAVFLCLVIIGFFESCIRCALIQSNSRYFDLFYASSETCMQIVDNTYKTYYSVNSNKPLSKELMKQAEQNPVILPDGNRLHNMPIDGGRAVWTEDISELIALRETLEDRKEELEERNALLQYEYEREKEYKTVEEQNRLYDLLQSKTQVQLDKIDSLVQDYRSAGTVEEKQKILAEIVVLGTFIKRRKDFVLSVDSTPTIPESKLTNAFAESFRALKLLGIKGTYLVQTGHDYLSGKTLTLAYDFFEDVLEAIVDRVHFLSVRVCNVGDTLRISVFADCAYDDPALLRKYPAMTVIKEDDGEYEFVLPLKGGAGK